MANSSRDTSTSPRHLVPKCRELSTWAASFEHVSSFLGDKFSILGKLSTNTWRRDVLCSRRRIFTVDDTIFSSILLFTHDRTHVVTASYHISYSFFFIYCWQKATLVKAFEANTCYIPFGYSVSPVHPFIGKLSSRFTSKSLGQTFHAR